MAIIEEFFAMYPPCNRHTGTAMMSNRLDSAFEELCLTEARELQLEVYQVI